MITPSFSNEEVEMHECSINGDRANAIYEKMMPLVYRAMMATTDKEMVTREEYGLLVAAARQAFGLVRQSEYTVDYASVKEFEAWN